MSAWSWVRTVTFRAHWTGNLFVSVFVLFFFLKIGLFLGCLICVVVRSVVSYNHTLKVQVTAKTEKLYLSSCLYTAILNIHSLLCFYRCLVCPHFLQSNGARWHRDSDALTHQNCICPFNHLIQPWLGHFRHSTVCEIYWQTSFLVTVSLTYL